MAGRQAAEEALARHAATAAAGIAVAVRALDEGLRDAEAFLDSVECDEGPCSDDLEVLMGNVEEAARRIREAATWLG